MLAGLSKRCHRPPRGPEISLDQRFGNLLRMVPAAQGWHFKFARRLAVGTAWLSTSSAVATCLS